MIEDTGINRNIMECKDICRFLKDVIYVVLIETLWNVKFKVVEDWKVHSGINRNIMECKVNNPPCRNYHLHVLIETLWNVKVECVWSAGSGIIVLIETLWNVK